MNWEQDNYDKMRTRNNRKRKQHQTILIISLVTLILMTAGGYAIIYRFMPNSTMESVYEHITDLSEKSVNTMLDGNYLNLENKPMINEGVIYLPADFVKEEFDPYVFWEPEADRLTITTLTEVIAMRIKDLSYSINDEPVSLNLPVLKEGDMAYIPQSFLLEMYNINMRYEEKYNMVIIDKKDKELKTSEILKDTELRFEPNIKSPIAEELVSGDEFIIYEEDEEFSKIRTQTGIIGYVKNKFIGEIKIIDPVFKEAEETPSQVKKIDGKIILLWDQVFDAKSAADPKKHSTVPTVNVLSPTWFSFDENSGNISDIVNIGDISYVQAAHKNGYQVWPLISDNFNSSVSHEILSVYENRQHVIKQILAFVAMYGVDGINIDFEAVPQADAPYYLQFLRELNPPLKQQGAILSVDMFVPLYTKYYNRTEVGKVVDYVCVMAYDEHYSGSPTTGPVASLGFVEEGIYATLSEVPKEKILMGLPFYNRVWSEKEKDGQISFKKQDTTMNSAYNDFIKNGVNFQWLSDLGYNYGEYKTTEKGEEITKKVWLEDENSIREKLKIAVKYDVAGLCCWKRGLEKSNVWEYIKDYKG